MFLYLSTSVAISNLNHTSLEGSANVGSHAFIRAMLAKCAFLIFDIYLIFIFVVVTI